MHNVYKNTIETLPFPEQNAQGAVLAVNGDRIKQENLH